MLSQQGNQGIQGATDRGAQLARAEGLNFAEAAGKKRVLLVGSPSTIADQMEDWFVDGACDGYVV